MLRLKTLFPVLMAVLVAGFALGDEDIPNWPGEVMPELVVCSPSGEVETVLDHEMPAMRLNELQKQQRAIQELKSELSALRAAFGQK